MSSWIALLLLFQSVASAFVCPPFSPIYVATHDMEAGLLTLSYRRHSYNLRLAAEGDLGNEISKAPTLNGKMVLPVKAMSAGLKGHKVAAVYAILNSNYKRGYVPICVLSLKQPSNILPINTFIENCPCHVS